MICHTEDKMPLNENELFARARRLHDKAPLIDLHADTFSMTKAASRFVEGSSKVHLDLPRMIEIGIWAEAFSLFVYPKWGKSPDKWFEIAVKELDAIHAAIENSGGKLALATDSAAIRENRSRGAVSAIIEIEGLHPLAGDLSKIEWFFERGVRIFTLTWNNSNPWATSCMDKNSHENGLSDSGREAIAEINRLGGFVDFSHSGERTFWETLDILDTPPICTHSCCMELKHSPRNLTDEQIKAIIDKGGIVGINFYPGFISNKEIPDVGVADLVNHIDHIVALGGEDILALGSDFDGVSNLPSEITDCTGIIEITVELLRRDYSDDLILKILGGNFLRGFERSPAGPQPTC